MRNVHSYSVAPPNKGRARVYHKVCLSDPANQDKSSPLDEKVAGNSEIQRPDNASPRVIVLSPRLKWRPIRTARRSLRWVCKAN
jgi:hypothetical protein